MAETDAITAFTPTESAPRRRLVTFLGTGKFDSVTGTYSYEQTRYVLGELPPVETPFVARGICGCVEIAEVRVLATARAWEAHGATLERALKETGVSDVESVLIPEGGSEADLWELFRHLKDQLRPPEGWEVVLDITHGFRCQPFYAAAALSFVRAVEENPAPVRVLYGAFRPHPEHSSLWDLTPVVDLLDWARALTVFLETGRAEGLKVPALRASRRLGQEQDLRAAGILRNLALALDQFSEDFATVRTGSLLLGAQSSAARLERALIAAEDCVAQHLPPLVDLLPRLRATVDGLPVADLGAPEGLQSLGRLAGLYVETDRVLEAVTVLREAWISRYAPANAVNPGDGFSDKSRQEAEVLALAALQGGRHDLFPVRNDLDHAGFRSNPGKPGRLRKQVEEQVVKFVDALGSPPPSPPSATARGMQRAIRGVWEAMGHVPTPEEDAQLGSEGDLVVLDSWLARLVRGERHPVSQADQ